MRSRAARVTSSAVAWIAMIGAAVFLYSSEQQIAAHRTALRAFDQHAREAADALADARAGQQAYVAAGQGVTFWMPKVAALIEQATATVDTLRSSAVSAEARQQLVDVAAAITQLNSVDRRARDYVRSGDQLMAGDMLFAEGRDVAAGALHQIEAARLGEARAADAGESDARRLEAMVLGGTAALTALVLALVAWARPAAVVGSAAEGVVGSSVGSVVGSNVPDSEQAGSQARAQATSRADSAATAQAAVVTAAADAPVRKAAVSSPAPAGAKSAAHESSSRSVQSLRAAASLCTEFGCVKDIADVSVLLGRAASVMDASGLIVWLGSTDGADLRPVLAHGYSEQTLARIPAVARSADNAAAAAYRTGELQVVSPRAGATQGGALVAPMLAADGCIGALTAEFQGRGEMSDSVQALAAIFAAQLAGLLGASLAAASGDGSSEAATGARAASA